MNQKIALDRAANLFPGGALGVLRLSDPIVVCEGRGSHIYDLEGREYLDYVLGSGPLILGHAHPAVVSAAQEAMAKGSTYYCMNPYAIDLAEELNKSISSAEKIRFMSGGSEATYLAVRLARAYTGRTKVIKFEGAFHGFHDISMTSISPKVLKEFPQGVPGSLGMSPGLTGEILVAPYNDLSTTIEIAESNRADVAAIIVEPIQREIAPVPGFLEGLRDLATRLGIILIFDEVVTGYRLTYGGAQDYFGVTPDLSTFGKIIGGGYPLSAVVGRADIMDLCDEKRTGGAAYFSGTLSGNPVATAAGLATLGELAKPGAYERLNMLGQAIREGFTHLLEETEITGMVVGEGPVWHIYFGVTSVHDYRSAAEANREASIRFSNGLLRRGIFVNPGKKAYVSLAHTEQDVALTLEVAREAMLEAKSLASLK